jgi:hypothetical protein
MVAIMTWPCRHEPQDLTQKQEQEVAEHSFIQCESMTFVDQTFTFTITHLARAMGACTPNLRKLLAEQLI